MTFWTSLGADPKRQHRFQVTISGMGAGSATYYIKSVKKPGLKIASKEHMYLGHKFNYPGLVSWDPQDLPIKMIDPVTPDSAANLSAIIQASGYIIPRDANSLRTVSKQRSVQSTGTIVISVLNENGDPIEKWTLQNAYISGIDFGDLDYSKDDLSEVSITVRYDWCELFTANSADAVSLTQLQATTATPPDLNTRFKPE